MLLERVRKGKVLVVGMGRSGLAAVRFLLGMGAKNIVANDHREYNQLEKAVIDLDKHAEVELVSGGHPSSLITEEITLVVKSPGVPPQLDIFEKAGSKNIPVISEIELAYPFLKAPLIGITGTNGKTTTTLLTAEIFERGGINKVFTAGNIGKPLCDVALESKAGDIIIAELSSFQLDNIINFRPFVSLLLNITADHLDYHRSRDKYIRAKEKIFVNQGASDVAVLNAMDEVVCAMHKKIIASPIFFSRETFLEEGFCVNDGTLGINQNGKFLAICGEEELTMPGKHNLENALAAAAAAWAGGVDLNAIKDGLCNFRGVEHRMELVRVINNISFVNDSKGTNPEACQKALESFPGKSKILIAGGKDKEADFTSLVYSIKKNGVKSLILLGETASKIKEAAIESGFSSLQVSGTLEEAVELAWKQAEEGDIVLLSPACASWDMFKDYEERGCLFKEKVYELGETLH